MARIRRLAAAIPRRHLVAAGVLALWIAVVVLSSGPEPGANRWLGFGQLPEILWATYALISILGLLFLLLTGNRGPVPERPHRRGRFWSYVIIAVLLALVMLAPRSFDPVEVEAAPTVAELEEVGPAAPSSTDGGPGWAQRTALAAIAVAAAAALIWTSFRRERSEKDPEGLEADDEGLPEAAEEAARRLLDTTDPRMAVLAAYARLETALEAQGRGRRPAETPTEHMARVGDAIALRTSALGRLALLYEHARFSGNDITDDHRREAQADLRHLIDDLRSPAPLHG